MYNSPLEQFSIFEFLLLFTNFNYFILITLLLVIYGNYNTKVKIGKIELVYQSLLDTVTNFLPLNLKMYLPVSYGFFLFVLFSNLVGLVPYSYSVTCELLLTLTLSLGILIGVTIIGFRKHGIHFLSYFLPSGTPLGLVPLLVLIELVSYIAKGLSLGIRLAGNIISGHLLLHIIGSFIFAIKNILLVLPLTILIALMGLEVIIGFLQAYVWTILFTVYLRDSLELH